MKLRGGQTCKTCEHMWLDCSPYELQIECEQYAPALSKPCFWQGYGVWDDADPEIIALSGPVKMYKPGDPDFEVLKQQYERGNK